MGAFLHALLQFDTGQSGLCQPPLAQLPVERAQHQQPRGQRGQRPGLLPCQRHHAAVGGDGEGPAQVRQFFLKGQIPLAARAVQAQFGAGRVVLGAQGPGHGAWCPARAVLFVVLQLLYQRCGQGAAGAVEPVGHGAQKHNALLVRHKHRVTQLGPGVGDGLHAHLDRYHADHPARFDHRGGDKQAGLARGFAHAIKAACLAREGIAKVWAVAVVLVDEAVGGVPVAGREREALRVHHVQHVRARVLVHRLQVGVGGVPHGL